MRNIIVLTGVILLNSAFIQAQDTIFFENFDASPGEKPPDWTTELEGPPASKWDFVNGGGTKDPGIPGSRKPPSAYSDAVNALFFYESLGSESEYLITPPIDLEFAVKTELRFRHAQNEGDLGPGTANDELRVYYKTHIDSPWVETKKIGEYTDAVEEWTEQTILIPSEAFSPTCYFGFKATTKYAWGVCIDDVTVVETGVLQRHVDNVSIFHENTYPVPTGSKNNPVLRITIRVLGNTGDVTLNSLTVKSLNSSDNDIPAEGVKLFYHYSSKNFYASVPCDTISLSSGYGTFEDINLALPTGYTYLWVTCDVKSDAIHGHYIDAAIEANNIDINGSTYPASEGSPTGERIIREAVFFDDFTIDQGWTLSGDFQRSRPLGLGGKDIGNPDPQHAAGDTMIIGNDLTGLGAIEGDYEPEVARYDNLATSPTFDLFYFNNVKLSFLRWLNVENSDTASIELSTDNGSSWDEIWSNSNNVITDNAWNQISLNIPDAHRKSETKIRINLGPTTLYNHFSGWNIENFAVTGNYIEYDVGPVTLLAPGDGCGHSSADTVTIKVKNYGPGSTPGKIPVKYSFDGGSSYTNDTINGAIPFDNEITYTFSPKIDLSDPGIYNVIIETALDVDEEITNNTFDTVLYVDPTYPLPYYQDFENGEDFWRATGTNASWGYGSPSGSVITDAASEPMAWVTKLTGNYNNDEDSYLTGPCFDLSGIDYPVFECNIFTHTENDIDGANVEYSLDNGTTWVRLGDKGNGDTYNWNWYNSDVITALTGNHGWTGEGPGWKTARIFLDTTIFRNQPGVKFRIHFSSNGSNTFEGIGIDDIRIYDAPRDVGVISIDSPVSACAQDVGDHVVITIQNFGLDTLMTGDTIIVGYDFESDPTVIDTFELTSHLIRNETVQYTFNKYFTVTSSGTKNIEAFTLLPDDIDFYNETTTNDTTSTTFDVDTTSFISLLPHIYTVRPDTVILNAYTGIPTDTYLWQDLSTTDSVFHVAEKADGIYHVVVSNGICNFRDTTYIYFLIADAGVTEIIHPVSGCELGSSVLPQVKIKNFGTDTLQTDDEITVGYKVDSDPEVEEIFTLNDVLYPDSTVIYTFLTAVDMSDIQTYSIAAYTILTDDDTTYNDTTITNVEVYGYTAIDLGSNVVVRALDYTIDAGAGYDSYEWQDESTNQTLTVDTTGWYTVTVKQGTKCENSDSVHVTIIIPDIKIDKFYSPTNACGLSTTESLELYVKNVGSDTLFVNDTIAFIYQLNGGSTVYDTLFLDNQVLPGDSVLFAFTDKENMNATGSYSFVVQANYNKDLIPANNTINQTVEVYGDTTVSLGSDAVSDTVNYTLDTGVDYDSYLWQDGSTERYYTVNYHNQTANQNYSVTVTDEHGCFGSDTIQVTFFLPNIGISNILNPISNCILSDQEQIIAHIRNFGSITVENKQTQIGVMIDGGTAIIEQTTISQSLEPDEYIVYTFDGLFDFSTQKVYNVKVFTVYGNDGVATDDTLNINITHYNHPSVNLGGVNDTIISSLPYTLDAGAGYENYEWNGSEGTQTYNVIAIGWYKAVVTDTNGCTGLDSVYVTSPASIPGVKGIQGELIIIPNPANEFLYVEFKGLKTMSYILELINERGQLVYIKEYKFVNRLNESLDVSHLTSGVYYLRIRTNEQQEVRKIIIQ
ncbi:MAG: T9SS type A sorting domain-containing protein [Bacteroidetes bacterium]|nr:T9SS type A sorting domain-containing protein [Bacteroidota bacterium]